MRRRPCPSPTRECCTMDTDGSYHFTKVWDRVPGRRRPRCPGFPATRQGDMVGGRGVAAEVTRQRKLRSINPDVRDGNESWLSGVTGRLGARPVDFPNFLLYQSHQKTNGPKVTFPFSVSAYDAIPCRDALGISIRDTLIYHDAFSRCAVQSEPYSDPYQNRLAFSAARGVRRAHKVQGRTIRRLLAYRWRPDGRGSGRVGPASMTSQRGALLCHLACPAVYTSHRI